jgi:hypothetical protein
MTEHRAASGVIAVRSTAIATLVAGDGEAPRSRNHSGVTNLLLGDTLGPSAGDGHWRGFTGRPRGTLCDGRISVSVIAAVNTLKDLPHPGEIARPRDHGEDDED